MMPEENEPLNYKDVMVKVIRATLANKESSALLLTSLPKTNLAIKRILGCYDLSLLKAGLNGLKTFERRPICTMNRTIQPRDITRRLRDILPLTWLLENKADYMALQKMLHENHISAEARGLFYYTRIVSFIEYFEWLDEQINSYHSLVRDFSYDSFENISIHGGYRLNCNFDSLFAAIDLIDAICKHENFLPTDKIDDHNQQLASVLQKIQLPTQGLNFHSDLIKIIVEYGQLSQFACIEDVLNAEYPTMAEDDLNSKVILNAYPTTASSQTIASNLEPESHSEPESSRWWHLSQHCNIL